MFNIFVLPATLVTALPKWLSTFDRMERLGLWTASATLDGNIPRESRWMERGNGKPTRYGLPWEQPHHEDAFLDGVLKNCPSVNTVCVNGNMLEEMPVVPGEGRSRNWYRAPH
ncbi:hypothetical protein BKA70DRAFT_44441 [Coprinopsis sp. MPI-PUGE-AT-0042]|nr:hypothetical protein BKA70DRAFT_44441 [Coprinopsis sp. MPI-PUGE-AT-0042]